MRQVYKIDGDGFYIEPIILKDNEVTPKGCIEIPPPQGLYRAKWTGDGWVEDMSQSEIDELNKPLATPTREERLEALENAMLDMMLGGMG